MSRGTKPLGAALLVVLALLTITAEGADDWGDEPSSPGLRGNVVDAFDSDGEEFGVESTEESSEDDDDWPDQGECLMTLQDFKSIIEERSPGIASWIEDDQATTMESLFHEYQNSDGRYVPCTHYTLDNIYAEHIVAELKKVVPMYQKIRSELLEESQKEPEDEDSGWENEAPSDFETDLEFVEALGLKPVGEATVAEAIKAMQALSQSGEAEKLKEEQEKLKKQDRKKAEDEKWGGFMDHLKANNRELHDDVKAHGLRYSFSPTEDLEKLTHDEMSGDLTAQALEKEENISWGSSDWFNKREVRTGARHQDGVPMVAAVVGGGPIGLLTGVMLRHMSNQAIDVNLYEARSVNRANPNNVRLQTMVLRTGVSSILASIPLPAALSKRHGLITAKGEATEALIDCREKVLTTQFMVNNYIQALGEDVKHSVLDAIMCGAHHPGMMLASTTSTGFGTVSLFLLQEILREVFEAYGGVYHPQRMVVSTGIAADQNGVERYNVESVAADENGRRVATAGQEDARVLFADLVFGAEGLPGNVITKPVFQVLNPARDAFASQFDDIGVFPDMYAATSVFTVPKSSRSQPEGKPVEYVTEENAFFSLDNLYVFASKPYVRSKTVPDGEEALGKFAQRTFRTPNLFDADGVTDLVYAGIAVNGRVFNEIVKEHHDEMFAELAKLATGATATPIGRDITLKGSTESNSHLDLKFAPTVVSYDKQRRLMAAAVGDAAVEPLFVLASGMNTGAMAALAAVRAGVAIAAPGGAERYAMAEKRHQAHMKVMAYLKAHQAKAKACFSQMETNFADQTLGVLSCHNPDTTDSVKEVFAGSVGAIVDRDDHYPMFASQMGPKM